MSPKTPETPSEKAELQFRLESLDDIVACPPKMYGSVDERLQQTIDGARAAAKAKLAELQAIQNPDNPSTT